MNWYYTPYVWPFLAVVIIAIALAVYAWRRRPASGASALAVLAVCVAIWAFGYTLEIAGADLSTKLFWGKAQYPGIVGIPLAWLIFALQYTGRDKWLTPGKLVWLSLIPLLTLGLAWTNEAHYLVWRAYHLNEGTPFLALIISYGPWFWVFATFAHSCILAGSVLFFLMLIRSLHLYRRQAAVLLIGVLAPGVGNILYLSGLNPLAPLDLTPFAFTISALAFSWGLFRLQVLDVAPVARDLLVENMEDGVLVLDTQNRVIDLNPAAQTVLRRTASQLLGQPVREALGEWQDLVERFINVNRAEAEILVDGELGRRLFNLHISPVFQKDRQIGRLVVLRDITERKQAEEALRQAKEAAEAASRAKSAFLAKMSHELRTPLNAILGFTQIISHSSAVPAEHQENLNIIKQSGEHLLTLINQVLDLSSVEAGHVSLNPQAFNLPRLLSQVIEMFRFQLEEKQLQLLVECADTVPPYVRTDAVKLRQVLINLLNNALKFTKEGHVILRVAAEQSGAEATGYRLLFEIEDTGPGISAAERDKLFEAFTQTQTGEQKQTGTGLGLTISRRFVELMGGTMAVESNVGVGTVVRFDIQVGLAEAGQDGSTLEYQAKKLRAQPAATALPFETLKSELTTLPANLVLRLAEAAELSDMEQVNETIAQIHTWNGTLGDALAQLAGRFDYDLLLRLAQAVDGPDSKGRADGSATG